MHERRPIKQRLLNVLCCLRVERKARPQTAQLCLRLAACGLLLLKLRVHVLQLLHLTLQRPAGLLNNSFLLQLLLRGGELALELGDVCAILVQQRHLQ
jgi:hypothetical protein